MEVTLFLEMTLTPRSVHPSIFYLDTREFNYYKNLKIKMVSFLATECLEQQQEEQLK